MATPPIEEILKNLQALVQRGGPELQKQLQVPLQQLTVAVQQLETELNTALAKQHELEAQVTQINTDNATLQQTVASQAKQIEQLKSQVSGVTSGATTPLGLAESFRGVMDSLQAQELQTAGPATTINRMDLELRGLVQVDQAGATNIVMPGPGTVVDANALSILRLSFAAVPGVAATPPPPPVVPQPPARARPKASPRRPRRRPPA